jgi:uncharacterized membrane protein YhaH (DUF805 family)
MAPANWLFIPGVIVFIVGFVAIIAAQILTSAQRIRDFNQTGWWVLLLAVPYVGIIVVLALCIQPGTQGDNSYGPDPLESK